MAICLYAHPVGQSRSSVMAAHFLQETEVLYVHLCGAFLAVGVGTAYTWVNTIMSFRMQPLVNTLTIARLRLFLSVLATVAFFSSILFFGETGVIQRVQLRVLALPITAL